MFEDSHYYFQKAADVLNLPERLKAIIWAPIRTVKVDLVKCCLHHKADLWKIRLTEKKRNYA